MDLTFKINEYSPYIPISINKEATQYFQREPCWNVICKYCKRENPGKNKKILGELFVKII